MNKLVLAVALAVVASSGCKKSGGGNSAAQKMVEFKDQMCACKDAKCAQEVSARMTKWSEETAKNQKEPPKPDDKSLAIAEELGKCMQTAMAAEVAAQTPPAAPGSAEEPPPAAGELPPECGEYKKAIENLQNCKGIAQETRDALTKAFNDAAKGWEVLPAAGKAKLSGSCKAGAEAVMANAKQLCGW